MGLIHLLERRLPRVHAVVKMFIASWLAKSLINYRLSEIVLLGRLHEVHTPSLWLWRFIQNSTTVPLETASLTIASLPSVHYFSYSKELDFKYRHVVVML